MLNISPSQFKGKNFKREGLHQNTNTLLYNPQDLAKKPCKEMITHNTLGVKLIFYSILI